MKVGSSHLTYCTNIHAGESWQEVFDVLRTDVCSVKARLCPEAPFGVGLRLSARAAQALSVSTALDELKAFLAEAGLYVFTLNGFPYGPFHGQAVKSEVYRPDWRQREREHYTDQLVSILAQLLPAELPGSISTVPGAFRSEASSLAAQAEIALRLLRQSIHLWRVKRETGCQLSLALEPEPCCLLETTQEAVTFFQEQLLNRAALDCAAKEAGVSRGQVEQAVREHLGVCLDTCHAAIEFESARDSLKCLKAAGVQLSKLQLSTGLKLVPSEQNLRALRAYDEAVYLHQVVARTRSGELLRFGDLPEALVSEEARAASEWRVHFHVPVHERDLGPFSNTQSFLQEVLQVHVEQSISPHLEVETYTWDVLPAERRSGSLVDSVVQELKWILGKL